MSLGDGEMNLPYEEVPDGPIPMTVDCVVAGGLRVSAIALDAKDGKKHPGLLFRFATPTGGLLAPIVLVATAPELRSLVPLVDKASASAIRAVTEAG